MTLQSFRLLLTQQPFQPFRLVMLSGKSYEVHSAARAMLTRSDILIGIGGEADGIPTEFRICSLLRVAAVEPLTGAVPTE